MSIVGTSEVAEYLRIDDAQDLQPHIEIAEAIVAGLLDAGTLGTRSVTETQTLRRSRNSVQLQDGPVSSKDEIQSVTVDGEAAMDLDDLRFPHYWVVERSDLFPSDTEITLEYTAGFTATTLPGPIRAAIIMLAAELYSRPRTAVQSERIGDYAYTMAPDADFVRKAAAAMVAPWKRPGL